MTTVVFDGRTLASDSQLNEDDRVRAISPRAPKFYVHKGYLLAWAGLVTWHPLFAEWIGGRRRRVDYPAASSESGSVVSVFDGREWRRYFSDGPGYEIVRGPWVIGSGSDFALAALLMGADAVQAVRVAVQLDINSGGPIFATDVSAFDRKKGLEVVEKYEQGTEEHFGRLQAASGAAAGVSRRVRQAGREALQARSD